MNAHPDIEQLETVAAGGLAAADVGQHVAACDECAREVAWLRAEKALVARRPSPPVHHLWAGIEQRVAAKPANVIRAHWAWRSAVAVAGVAAAAAVVFAALRPAPVVVAPGKQVAHKRSEYKPDAKTLAALDRAETDYRDAAKVLEEEYARMRPALDPELAKRWDETLTRARTQLGEARAVAAEDVNARMQVLDGYAGYLRSLRNVVQQSEEANP